MPRPARTRSRKVEYIFDAPPDKVAELLRLRKLVAASAVSERIGKWYCGDRECNGLPHAGHHWCEHAICRDHAGRSDQPPPPGECEVCDQHQWQCCHCRADQRPPLVFTAGEVRGWLMMAGRGFGKTRSGAEWLADQAKSTPKSYWGVIGPDFDVVRDTCIEGESGLLEALGWERADDRYDKTRLRLRLDNGSMIRAYSAETPRKARGPNLSGAWLEELAQWSYREMWDNLFPSIRRGLAQYVITTTPSPVPLVREFTNRTDGTVVITRGSTFANERNLAPHAVAELRQRWAGTRRERQELYGELMDDVAGALWQTSTIEESRGTLVRREAVVA
jgi:phage terminase large subunit-like protein